MVAGEYRDSQDGEQEGSGLHGRQQQLQHQPSD